MIGTYAPIAEVDAIPLRRPAADASGLDGSSETILVRIADADGRVGIGEADAPAVAVRELVLMDDVHAWSRGLRTMLVFFDMKDPSEIPPIVEPFFSLNAKVDLVPTEYRAVT